MHQKLKHKLVSKVWFNKRFFKNITHIFPENLHEVKVNTSEAHTESRVEHR